MEKLPILPELGGSDVSKKKANSFKLKIIIKVGNLKRRKSGPQEALTRGQKFAMTVTWRLAPMAYTCQQELNE